MPGCANQKTVEQIHAATVEASSSEDEYSFHVHKFKGSNKQPKTKVRMLDTEIEMLVDTGITVNNIAETTLSKLVPAFIILLLKSTLTGRKAD